MGYISIFVGDSAASVSEKWLSPMVSKMLKTRCNKFVTLLTKMLPNMNFETIRNVRLYVEYR